MGARAEPRAFRIEGPDQDRLAVEYGTPGDGVYELRVFDLRGLLAVAEQVGGEPKVLWQTRTWYRSVLPDGTVWCETSDPAEVVDRSGGHAGMRYQKHETFEVSAGWRPWKPEDVRTERPADA